MKKSFKIYIDSLDILDDLDDSEIASLFKAIRAFHNGDEVELDKVTRISFNQFKKQFERDNEAYKKVCETNKRIANERSITKREEPLRKVTLSTDKDKDKIRDIVQDLNVVCGTKFKVTTVSTYSAIKARLLEGYTLDDFKSVHKTKFNEWVGTDMAKHLNPTTLYRPGNFEKYLNQDVKEEVQVGGVTW